MILLLLPVALPRAGELGGRSVLQPPAFSHEDDNGFSIEAQDEQLASQQQLSISSADNSSVSQESSTSVGTAARLEREVAPFARRNCVDDQCWPLAFLIGVQKSATTAVANFLVQKAGLSYGKGGKGCMELPVWEANLPDAKETHAFDKYYVDHPEENTSRFTCLFRPPADCAKDEEETCDGAVGFMESTPNYFSSDDAQPTLLARMPPELLQQSRFVVILREPVSRALSWFNHMLAFAARADPPWDLDALDDPDDMLSPCFRSVAKSEGRRVSFDGMVQCAMLPEASEGMLEDGNYLAGMDRWVPANSLQRGQLLVTSYDTLLKDPSQVVQRIARHFGLATPRRVNLKTSNTQRFDDKVVVPMCKTVAALRTHFGKLNQALFARLREDRKAGWAPPEEEPLDSFTEATPCSQVREIATKDVWLLEEPALDNRTDDEMLEASGILDQMTVNQTILFAVMTGEGMYSPDAARTWCGQTKACVYFSNSSTPQGAKGRHSDGRVKVIDTFTSAGYPNWVSNEAHWPIYRSAQLRFLPALHWMRQRIDADPEINPVTQQFFGAAQWVLVVDDDTFVRSWRLARYLETLDHREKIYAGAVPPEDWLPSTLDNSLVGDHALDYSDPTVMFDKPFALGGAGSIFSRAALVSMDTADCVRRMRPDGPWWQFQSDWALAACASLGGMTVQATAPGLQQQCVCTDARFHPFSCATFEERAARNGTGGIISWDSGKKYRGRGNHLAFPLNKHTLTIHPIKSSQAFDYLHGWTD